MIKKLKVFSVVIFVSLFYCGILGMLLGRFSALPAASSSAHEGVRLPVIMYHSVLKDTSLSGEYVITPEMLEKDIKYLKKNGYTFISAKDLIDYTGHNAPLPEKPVILTFDDGFYNHYGYVLPILEKYGAKGIFAVVGSYTDEYEESKIKNLTYGYMSWNEIYDMFLDSHSEIANHSYDFHTNTKGRKGSKRKIYESEDTYEQIFHTDTEKAQNRFMTKTGFAPVIYVYPFGEYSEGTTNVLKDMGYKMSFTCDEGINYITDSDSLFLLKRYNRPSDINTADFFEMIEKNF